MTETAPSSSDAYTVSHRRAVDSSITYKYMVGILLTGLIALVGFVGGNLVADQKQLQVALQEERDARLRREGRDQAAEFQRAADLQKIEDLRVEMSKLASLVDDHQRWLAATFGKIPDRTKYGRQFDQSVGGRR